MTLFINKQIYTLKAKLIRSVFIRGRGTCAELFSLELFVLGIRLVNIFELETLVVVVSHNSRNDTKFQIVTDSCGHYKAPVGKDEPSYQINGIMASEYNHDTAFEENANDTENLHSTPFQ